MYKLLSEAVDTALALKSLVANANHCEVVVAPVFTALKAISARLEGSNIRVAAQDCAAQNDFGAHTGEVAPVMLKDAGCSHVIIGHSERRHGMGEQDAVLNKKAKAALAAGLSVIFCIGELLAEREAGLTESVLDTQLAGGLAGLTDEQLAKLVIAYEPVWAIGTGKVATTEQAQAAHAFIRQKIAMLFSEKVASALLIQYGGSVKPDNAAALLHQPDVDGALVGGASLKADSFLAIVAAAG